MMAYNAAAVSGHSGHRRESVLLVASSNASRRIRLLVNWERRAVPIAEPAIDAEINHRFHLRLGDR